MNFKLEKVVPWGRSLSEYADMFALTQTERRGTILDCGGGPSSFNGEMLRSGGRVISCDPLYQFSTLDIQSRIEATYPVILEGLKVNFDRFVWQTIPSPQALGELRLATMQLFLEDFEQGRAEGRYLPDELPHLPFASDSFELALCSHLLFTYSEQFSLQFHLDSILEMSRVAREVRIFPLLENFSGERSQHLEPVCRDLEERGYLIEIERVPYEFQLGGNEMLRIRDF